MVETRASRRAAEEDSCNSSQPVRSRSRVKNTDSTSVPQTSTSRARSQSRDEGSLSSVQAPATKKGRSRSSTRPQTPAHTPRTRSRARKEAEESIASSEVRVVTTDPHPAEEDSNSLRNKITVKKAVSARQNRTSELVPSTARAHTRASQKEISLSNVRAQTPAQTPRTRSRARREAEESIASSEVHVSIPPPHLEEEDSSSLRTKTLASKISFGRQNRMCENVSEASTTSRRIRSVARRTRAFGARDTSTRSEVGRVPEVSFNVAAKGSRGEGAEQPVSYDVEHHNLITPDLQRVQSLSRAHGRENRSQQKNDVLQAEHPMDKKESIDVHDDEQSSEQRTERTKLLHPKPHTPSQNQRMILEKECGERQPAIVEFKSNRPVSKDPKADVMCEESPYQFSNTEASRPLSKHSIQADFRTLNDAQSAGHMDSLAISLPSNEFDEFNADQVHAILVEDDEPPPAPEVQQCSGESTDVALKNFQAIVQESHVGETGKNVIDSKALAISDRPNKLDLNDTIDKAAPSVIDLEEAESRKDGAPLEREGAPPKDPLETEKREDPLVRAPRDDPRRIVDRIEPLPEALTRRREQDEASFRGTHQGDDVAMESSSPVIPSQVHEVSQRLDQRSGISNENSGSKMVSGHHNEHNSGQSKDILDEGNTRVVKEHEYEAVRLNDRDSAFSTEDLRHESENISHSAEQKDKSMKISSVEDILNLDNKNMSLFFRRNSHTSRICRKLLGQYYAQQTKHEFGSDARYQFLPRRRRVLPPMGPLAQIEIGDHFDNDQLWEELELRNKPLLAYLHRKVKAIEKKNEDDERALRRVTMNDDDSGSDQIELEGATEVNEQSGNEDTHGVDSVLNEDSKSDGGGGDEKPLVVKVRKGNKGQGKTVRFAEAIPSTRSIESKGDNEVEDSLTDRKTKARKNRPRLEDGFFSIADMDRFADEAEELALLGKLMDSDEERSNSDGMSDESESEVEEVQMEDSRGRFIYSDFFDPPSKVSGSDKGVAKALKLLGEDDLSDSGYLEDDLDNEEGRAVGITRETDAMADDRAELTPLQRMRAMSTKRIQILEEASVSKKSWELRGEVSAFARPKDSLLDTEMQHDIAVKPKAFLSSEINESIEEVIKQRIVDGLFDDVVMPFPEEYVSKTSRKSRQELPEISQEKPTEGLAELYAKEFTEEREKKNKEILSSKVEQRELDEPLREEQKEVNRLFEKLSKKLDALSSLHYTPIPDDTKVDLTVKTNVKAIASEEAIPEGVSSAALLAPKEVYSVDKKDLVGEKELGKEKRRAARRRRKSKRRKTQTVDESRKDAMIQADPILAEKRRADAALVRRGKKPKLAENDSKLAARPSTNNLIKRFGVVTDPGMETSQRKKPASHFRL